MRIVYETLRDALALFRFVHSTFSCLRYLCKLKVSLGGYFGVLRTVFFFGLIIADLWHSRQSDCAPARY